MDYLTFDPAPFAFAPPRVPVLPVWRPGMWRWRPGGGAGTPAWAPQGRLYARARYALAQAFALCGVGPQGALLAPAYHCRTMLDPALALGAAVQLYPLPPDLQIDASALEAALVGAPVPVKAVLVPHYFGRRQVMAPLAAVCRQHGVALVEDCAHALPLLSAAEDKGERRMGVSGTFCVASPYKFLPCDEGGALWRGDGQPLPDSKLRQPKLSSQVRQLWHLWDQARQPMPAAAPIDVAGSDQHALAAQAAAQAQIVVSDQPSGHYQPGLATQACSPLSRLVMRHLDLADALRLRHAHWARLAQASTQWPGAKALWSSLDAADTPYMFALLVDEPAQVFAALKRLGVPIWRWDSQALSGCATALRYRLGLLHLPCHQSLTPQALDWIIATLGEVLSRRAASPPSRHTAIACHEP